MLYEGGGGECELTSVWPDVENHTLNFDKWNNAFRIQPDVLKFCQKFRLLNKGKIFVIHNLIASEFVAKLPLFKTQG